MPRRYVYRVGRGRTFEIPSHDYFLYRLTVIVINMALMSRKKARGLTRLAGSDLSAPRDRRAPPYLRRAFTCEFFHVKRTRDGASACVPHADPAPRRGPHSGATEAHVRVRTVQARTGASFVTARTPVSRRKAHTVGRPSDGH